MNPGLRTKIVLLTVGIMLIAIGAIIFASHHHFTGAYSEVLQSRSLFAGKGLKLQLNRLFQFGIKLENLTGFDEQCLDVVRKYEGVRYAMVTDLNGRVLFHSDPLHRGSNLDDPILQNGLQSVEGLVVYSENRGGGLYTAFTPVFDTRGTHIATVGIGFAADIIRAKARQVVFSITKVGLIFLLAAVLALIAALSFMVTKPLTRLLIVIQEMREKGEVFTRKVDISTSDEIGQVARAFNMMTENLRETTVSKEVFEYQATHDGLTGLPNRHLLADRLEQAVFMARRYDKKLAVLFLDLDNFKLINDSLGHEMGDKTLQAIAQRLQDSVRASDTVSRQSGDEFVVLLSEVSEYAGVATVAEKIIQNVSQPLTLENHELPVTCSVGVSLYPKDGESVQELMKNADAALYRAKEQGKNIYRFFMPEMNAKLLERIQLERQLRLAIERQEFLLYYQPKVNLHTGRIVGMEALIRWQHPEKGIVPPSEFIPLAEETGLIEEIGEWVLRTACLQTKAWHSEGFTKLTVAVNVSARQFRLGTLVEMVRKVVHDCQIDPAFVELEVTESLLLLDTESVQSILQSLKDIGVHLTMDDFGTGYSSLSYLKRFPFDTLKLDIAFVRGITYDPDSAAIALAIITMAQALNLKVVAEGVETEGQISYLCHHGCCEMQGYYFSRPLPVSEFSEFIRRDQPLPWIAREENSS